MFPITTGKLEISGKTELKVNGAGAVVHLFHFYTLWIPIGKCLTPIDTRASNAVMIVFLFICLRPA